MRKIALILGIVITLSFPVNGQTEESSPIQKQVNQVSTMIYLKNDWVHPVEGEGYWKEALSVYWYNDRFGAGIDVTAKPKFDFLDVRPYLTVNQAPFYFLAGLATDSTGADYFQAGVWYFDTLGKFCIMLDLRNYWGIDGGASDYTEDFLEVIYSLDEKFFVGLDLCYDHWWEESDHNYYLVGPFIGYQITKSTSAHLRSSRDWEIIEESSSRTDALRLEIRIYF